MRDADKSIQLNSNWEKGYYRRGIALQNLGQIKESMEAFQKCQQLNPKNEDFKKAFDSARKELFKGLTEAEIIKLEGNEAFKAGRIEEAASKYTQALQRCGNDDKSIPVRADLYANRAACYVQLYEPTKVRADCDAALKLQPGHVKALLRRGQALEALEKYKMALEDFEAVLKSEPNAQMALQGVTRLRNALRRQENEKKNL